MRGASGSGPGPSAARGSDGPGSPDAAPAAASTPTTTAGPVPPAALSPTAGWVLSPHPAGPAEPLGRVGGLGGSPLGAAPGADPRVFGLTASERMRRALVRAGVPRAEIVPASARPPFGSDRHLVVRGDCILDERLVQALRDAPDTLLVACPEGGTRELPLAVNARGAALEDAVATLRDESRAETQPGPRAGLRVVRPPALVPSYNPALRKLDPPLVFQPRPTTVREVEARLFAASYKGLTDLVTKWVWPAPARSATRFCARRGITPNAVTVVSYVLVVLATWLFAEGRFALGLAAAWLMTFLDTVDGKLARVTLTSSRIGNVLDHGLDLVHPPFWWAAWAVGLAAGEPLSPFEWTLLAIVVGGYLAGRALEGVFLASFGFEIFCWRRFDGFFRTIIARRNPNLLLLTAGVAFGRPDAGLVAVAVWTLASIAVHVVRLIQAFGERSVGELVRPWNQDPA